MSQNAHKSLIGHDKALLLDEGKTDGVIQNIYTKHMGEKKREKVMKNFEEDKLWFITNKMSDKKDVSKAVLED